MNLNYRALMIGTGVAAAIHILITLCSQLISYIAFTTTRDTGITMVAINTLTCCIALAIDMLAGYLYTHFHTRQASPLQRQTAIIGGAISGAVTHLIGSLSNSFLSFISNQSLDLYTEMSDLVKFDLIVVTISIGISLIIAPIFGAIGGAIGAQIRGNK